MVYVDLSNSEVFGDKKHIVDSGSGFSRKINYEGLVDNIFYKMSTSRDSEGLTPNDRLFVSITAVNLLTGRECGTLDIYETIYDGFPITLYSFQEYHDMICEKLERVIQESKLSEATEESLKRLDKMSLPDWIIPPEKEYRQK